MALIEKSDAKKKPSKGKGKGKENLQKEMEGMEEMENNLLKRLFRQLKSVKASKL